MADNRSASSVHSYSFRRTISIESARTSSENITSITNFLDSSISPILTDPVRTESEEYTSSPPLNTLEKSLNIKDFQGAEGENKGHVATNKTSAELLNNSKPCRTTGAHSQQDPSTPKSINRSARHRRELANPIDHLGLTINQKMTFSSPRAVTFLVASLGNPPPYHSTRHSAGHIVLKHLQCNLSLPSFQKSKAYGSGFVSIGADVGRPEFTLWQSPSLMNTSGPPLLQAYKTFLSAQQASATDPITGLVVLHDEMETEPGKIKVRRGGNSSAKGHNGIKSVQASFSGGGLLSSLGDRLVKIGIGIGRPSSGSRESKDVSAYVLGHLTSREKDGLDSAARDIENVLYQEIARMQQQKK